jgi:hypothetical protein
VSGSSTQPVVEVTGWVEDPDTYPMAAKRHSIEYLREVAHLRPPIRLVRGRRWATSRRYSMLWRLAAIG